jgi:hypothetical protein
VLERGDSIWVEIPLPQDMSRSEFSLRVTKIIARSEYYLVPDLGESSLCNLFSTVKQEFWKRAWKAFSPPSVAAALAVKTFSKRPLSEWTDAARALVDNFHPDFVAALPRIQFLVRRLIAFEGGIAQNNANHIHI